MSGPGGFSEEEELVMGGEYEGAKEERAKIVAHVRSLGLENALTIADAIERNEHAGVEVPKAEALSAAVVRELEKLREWTKRLGFGTVGLWASLMLGEEINRRIAAVRGSLEQPQCTGTLVHNEYTPCPVHDHK